MSAQTIFEAHRRECPLTDAEAVDVLLEYIDNQESPEGFSDFLDNRPPD